MNSRRDFLKKAALLSGATGMASVIPMSIQKAMAINADPGTTFYDAEHVVFLMQENRSFDHFFGTLKGVRGFNDPRAVRLPNNNKVWLQEDQKGNTFAPFHVDINKTKITWQGGLAHSWPDQVAARNQGRHNNWVPAKSSMCLGYYKREDIPFYYALADAFTICDHSFCSSLTGTTPNRLFFWTGTIRPEQNGESIAVVNNSQAESQDNVFVDWESFPEILENNGIDWRVYQNEVWTAKLPEETDDWLGNYGDNPLEYIKRHHVKLSAYFRKNGDSTSTPKLTAEEVKERYDKLSEKERNLINKAFTTNIQSPEDYLALAPYTFTDDQGIQQTINIPKNDIFHEFRKDVDQGKLPTVSWLVAPQRFSDHTSSPLYGTWYVSEALDILTKNPEVWKKTIFILTYDENDGYFDHLPPFVAPNPKDASTGKVSSGIDADVEFERIAGSPLGLGYRIPFVVASPWSKGGYVNSQVFDHTSSLMFLEKFLSKKTNKKIKSNNISSWRRAVCGDLTSVFRPYKGEKLSPPAALKRETVIDTIQNAKNKPPQVKPSPLSKTDIENINTHPAFSSRSSPFMPKQEKGMKPACALPYRLYADCTLNTEKNKIELTLEAGKALFGAKTENTGAAFNMNTYNTRKQTSPRAYALSPGALLTDEISLEEFSDDRYDLALHGPNGFFRQFTGSKQDPALRISCTYEPISRLNKKLNGNIKLTMENMGNHAQSLNVKNTSYQHALPEVLHIPAKGKTELTVVLKKSYGWYDVVLESIESPGYLRKYAGHVETEEESITDPVMGAMA